MKQIASWLFAALLCVGLVFAVLIGLDNRQQGEERDALVAALQQQVIDLGGDPVVATGSLPLDRGPAGRDGQDGQDGRDGRNGRDGIAVNGADGQDGQDGQDGRDSTIPGPKGDRGEQGPPGAASTVPGPPGPAGDDGADGLPGSPPFSITIGNLVCTDPDGDLRYDCQEV